MPDTDTAPAPTSDPAPASPVKPPRRDIATRITPERSRMMQAAALAARIAKRDARLAAQSNPAPRAAPAPAPGPDNPSPDSFVAKQLARCRARLDALYAQLEDPEAKLSPTEVDKLASAIQKFSEIERGYAMRPAPGSLKPGEPAKAQSRAAWLLGSDDAAPAAPASTAPQE